jgi:hypothetical protein
LVCTSPNLSKNAAYPFRSFSNNASLMSSSCWRPSWTRESVCGVQQGGGIQGVKRLDTARGAARAPGRAEELRAADRREVEKEPAAAAVVEEKFPDPQGIRRQGHDAAIADLHRGDAAGLGALVLRAPQHPRRKAVLVPPVSVQVHIEPPVRIAASSLRHTV